MSFRSKADFVTETFQCVITEWVRTPAKLPDPAPLIAYLRECADALEAAGLASWQEKER